MPETVPSFNRLRIDMICIRSDLDVFLFCVSTIFKIWEFYYEIIDVESIEFYFFIFSVDFLKLNYDVNEREYPYSCNFKYFIMETI